MKPLPGEPASDRRASRYAFGPVLVDVASRQIWRDGRNTSVPARAFDALVYLLAHADRTVTKEELIDAVWIDVSVSEDSLVHSISVLRRALGDDSTHPNLIVTVPRRGYRFTGAVRALYDPSPDEPAGDAAVDVEVAPAAAGAVHATPRRLWSSPFLLALLPAAIVLFVIWRGFVVPQALPRSATVLLTQPAPPDATLASGGILSPDSRYMVFVAQDRQATQARLYLKQMNSGDLKLLAGTEGAAHPFWSPTSDVVGFFASGALKSVNLRGDAPTVIAPVPVSAAGGAWSSRGSPILFSDWQTGLYQVSATGGASTRVTTVNRPAGDRAHTLPQFLPDGVHFVYFVLSEEHSGTYLGSLDSPKRTKLLDTPAVYSAPGYLLYVQNDTLTTQRFDPVTFALSGKPQTVARNVSAPNDADGQMISASPSLLTFRPGAKTLELAWFDRTGQRLGTIPGGKAIRSPTFSPDQKQLIAMGLGPTLWVVDLAREAAATRSEGHGMYPLWSPDGNRIAYESVNSLTLYVRDLGGTAPEQIVVHDNERKILSDWTPSGDYLVYSTLNASTKLDVCLLPMSGDRKPSILLHSPFNEMQARVAPNGRSIAYVSDESGNLEVYVQDFPALGHKRIVSIGGGSEPMWRHDGKELFYLSPDYSIVSVSIGTNDPPQIGQPKPLFRPPVNPSSTRNHYTATLDGQRFLVNVEDQNSHQSPITVMVNWIQGLEDR
jgi:DNA-binding winged helix-turn-helix (wHTH) protein/Tol biopolymer transport system component